MFAISETHSNPITLLNTDLTQEQNLPSPYEKLPYIWIDFPEPSSDTVLSQLHHGK